MHFVSWMGKYGGCNLASISSIHQTLKAKFGMGTTNLRVDISSVVLNLNLYLVFYCAFIACPSDVAWFALITISFATSDSELPEEANTIFPAGSPGCRCAHHLLDKLSGSSYSCCADKLHPVQLKVISMRFACVSVILL
jgi:hypothetical protein